MTNPKFKEDRRKELNSHIETVVLPYMLKRIFSTGVKKEMIKIIQSSLNGDMSGKKEREMYKMMKVFVMEIEKEIKRQKEKKD